MTKRLTRILFATALAAIAITACGDYNVARTSSAARADSFVLREWSVTAPTNGIHAGSVIVTASNEGHETHELVLVRAGSVAALPTKSDGSVDEDKIAEADKVGEIADLAAGTQASKTFELSAGNYVALCNLVDQTAMMGNNGGMGNGMDHVHYRLGMVATFTVT